MKKLEAYVPPAVARAATQKVGMFFF